MRILTALSVVTMALWAAGCATNHESDRAAMDRALENTLRAEMSRYGALAANAPDVRFTAQDGTVTVSGAVPSEKDREMLSSLVRNTAGVVAVNDNLRVLNPPTGVVAPARIYSQPPVTVQTAPVYSVAPAAIVPGTVAVVPGAYPNLRMMAATPDDELLARRVADQLALDGIAGAWIEGAKITISDQTAYLKGVVDSPEIRQSVVSSISRTKGLRAVYDQLLVR